MVGSTQADIGRGWASLPQPLAGDLDDDMQTHAKTGMVLNRLDRQTGRQVGPVKMLTLSTPTRRTAGRAAALWAPSNQVSAEDDSRRRRNSTGWRAASWGRCCLDWESKKQRKEGGQGALANGRREGRRRVKLGAYAVLPMSPSSMRVAY